MKYLVLECHTAYAVVLRDDGRCLKAANMHYEVGQTVTNVVEMVLPQMDTSPKKRTALRWRTVLVAMAACLVLVFGGFFMNNMPYASIYMAINPEVRIDVSRTDRVVEVTGINADGLDLLEGYEPESRDLDLVMDGLVDGAIDMGYLYEGGHITLTLDANDKWVTGHEAELNAHLTQHLEDKIAVTIEITPQKSVQTQPHQSTSEGQRVVIPIGPEGEYGASDYGDETGDSGYNSDSSYGDAVTGDDDTTDTGNNDSDYGDSVYGPQNQGNDSGYDIPDEEENSDYDALDEDSDSIYEEQMPEDAVYPEYDD